MYSHIGIPRHRDMIHCHTTAQSRPIGKAAACIGLGSMPSLTGLIECEDLQPTIGIAPSSDLTEPCFITYNHPALKVPIGAVLPVRPNEASSCIDREDLEPTVDATDHRDRT